MNKRTFTKSERRALVNCVGEEKSAQIEQEFNVLKAYGGIDAFTTEKILKENLHKYIEAEKEELREQELSSFRSKIKSYIQLAHKKALKART